MKEPSGEKEVINGNEDCSAKCEWAAGRKGWMVARARARARELANVADQLASLLDSFTTRFR